MLIRTKSIIYTCHQAREELRLRHLHQTWIRRMYPMSDDQAHILLIMLKGADIEACERQSLLQAGIKVQLLD